MIISEASRGQKQQHKEQGSQQDFVQKRQEGTCEHFGKEHLQLHLHSQQQQPSEHEIEGNDKMQHRLRHEMFLQQNEEGQEKKLHFGLLQQFEHDGKLHGLQTQQRGTSRETEHPVQEQQHSHDKLKQGNPHNHFQKRHRLCFVLHVGVNGSELTVTKSLISLQHIETG